MPAYRTRDSSARPLQVTTDGPPPPPQVAIISPTPRAFTFPIQDVPYPSASSSPFEQDLKPRARTPPLRTFSPTSSIGTDTSSLFSTPSAPASSQASHKRRRSAASDIGERRPKKGDDDYIKRPENAFILFRRKCCEDRQAQEEADEGAAPVKKQRQADLSKTISQQWRSLPTEERQKWEDLAKEKKKEHEAMYPNYVYRPQRVKKAKKGKTRGEDADADNSISFVLPVPSPPHSPTRVSHGHMRVHGHGRRAASAPTPPPAYQTIQLPQVIMPSCPTSPSLVPRISRRTPLPHIPPPSDIDPLTHFEFLPNGVAFPPSFQQPTMFEGSFQPSEELLQSMFQVPEQPEFSERAAPLLHSLTIPRESMMSSGMMSPADSIASSLVSPLDSFSPSPCSPQNGPFTPVDTLPMMSLLSVTDQCIETVHEDVSQIPAHNPFAIPDWQAESLWQEADGMLPEDFNVNAIPRIELGMSQYESEMQLAAIANRFDDCGYDRSVFAGSELMPVSAPETTFDDFNDTTPGHDPYAGMFSYQYEPVSW